MNLIPFPQFSIDALVDKKSWYQFQILFLQAPELAVFRLVIKIDWKKLAIFSYDDVPGSNLSAGR